MPTEAKGARLWFKRGNIGADGKRRPGTWTIKDDGGVRISTGIRAARAGKPPQDAQDALAKYILEKRDVPREKHRGAHDVQVADVITLYVKERAPNQARPLEVGQRCEALLTFWAQKRLSDVTGRACREYVDFRGKPVARRELEDLRTAINYHRKEGYCREVVEVTLPDAAEPRDRWLTRSEAARLIWAAWRYREVQKGKATGRRSRRHVARFILVALYTGTRAGAVCAASLGPVKGSGWIDLERGVFYRRASGERETKKRRPPVQIPGRLLAHMRRWASEKVNLKTGAVKPAQIYAVEWNGKPIGTGVEKAFRSTVSEANNLTIRVNARRRQLVGSTEPHLLRLSRRPQLDLIQGDVIPHTLRHTAATWVVANGTGFEKAADFLGMSVETLQRVYRHHAPGFQQDAADNIVKKPAIRSTIRSTA